MFSSRVFCIAAGVARLTALVTPPCVHDVVYNESTQKQYKEVERCSIESCKAYCKGFANMKGFSYWAGSGGCRCVEEEHAPSQLAPAHFQVTSGQLSCYEEGGRCQVKVSNHTEQQCAGVPKGEWFNDDDYGGKLGVSATLADCQRRGWKKRCGASSVEYRIESPTTALITTPTTADCFHDAVYLESEQTRYKVVGRFSVESCIKYCEDFANVKGFSYWSATGGCRCVKDAHATRQCAPKHIQVTSGLLSCQVKVRGLCQVKVSNHAEQQCAAVPKGEWFNDDDYGGELGLSATLVDCQNRGWSKWCGASSVEYRIESPTTTSPTTVGCVHDVVYPESEQKQYKEVDGFTVESCKAYCKGFATMKGFSYWAGSGGCRCVEAVHAPSQPAPADYRVTSGPLSCYDAGGRHLSATDAGQTVLI